MTWGLVAVAGATLVGGVLSSNAASNAADTQSQAAHDGSAAQERATMAGIDENRRQFNLVQSLLQPYVQAGGRGLAGYENLIGTQGPQAQQQAIDQIQSGPMYGSLTRAGEQAILANASATGGLRSGNTQGALANFRTDVLSKLIDQQIGRYGALGTVGQNSATGTGNAALATGGSNASLFAGLGNAQAAALNQAGAAQAGGGLAGANAITNAIGGIGGLFASRAYGGTGGVQAAFSQTPAGSAGFGTGLAYGNQDFGQYF